MRVIVLGGTGFVGRAISRNLNKIAGIDLTVAARNPGRIDDIAAIQLDASDPSAVEDALSDFDVVINCVTGTADTIVSSATNIGARTTKRLGPRQIIHMSSMAVYGRKQGRVNEHSSLPSSGNWYAEAKRQAERRLEDAAKTGVSVTMLRIGCVIGAESPLWVDRIGLLIARGRLGDIGLLGDGWSNLVHVNDIVRAVVLILHNQEKQINIYNLSAPDSPRWNDYFRDFALAAGCVPLKYKTRRSILIESYLKAPLIKGAGLLLKRFRLKRSDIATIPPSLLRLWGQQIRLDCTAIEQELGMTWTTYQSALADSADYFKHKFGI